MRSDSPPNVTQDDPRHEAGFTSENHPDPPTPKPSEPVQSTHGHAINASWDYWSGELRAALGAEVSATVWAGRVLLLAKKCLGHGNFTEFLEQDGAQLDDRTAQMLMRIASHPVLCDDENHADLPRSVVGLYVLSSLDPSMVEEGLESGTIHAGMTLQETKAFVGAQQSRCGTPKPTGELAA